LVVAAVVAAAFAAAPAAGWGAADEAEGSVPPLAAASAAAAVSVDALAEALAGCAAAVAPVPLCGFVAALPLPGSVGAGCVNRAGIGSGTTTAAAAPLLLLLDLVCEPPVPALLPLPPLVADFVVVDVVELVVLVVLCVVAAGGVAGLLPVEVAFWPFCTRLKNCAPPLLSDAREGGGGGSAGRAMAGTAVMVVLSSLPWSASDVPARAVLQPIELIE
jgi:hypothetical protein